MVKRSFLGATVLVLASSIFLSACGSNNEGSGGNASEKAAGTNAPSANKQVTLTVFSHKAGSEAGALPDLIKKFETENPDIKIDYEATSTGSGYHDALKAKFAGGEGPDVYMNGNSEIEKVFAKSGDIANMSDRPWASELGDAVKALAQSTSEDKKVYGAPIELSGLGMFFNTDVLEKNGLQIPKNWEEFLAACEKLKQAGVTPIVMGNKTGWSAAVFADLTVFQNNTDTTAAQVESGELTMDAWYGPALKKIQQLSQSGYINGEQSLGMEFSDAAISEYLKGNSAFMIGGTWMISQLSQANKDFKFVFGAAPVNDSGNAKVNIIYGTGWWVNAKSKQLDAANTFVDWFMKDENLSQYVKSQSAFSPLVNGTSTDDQHAAPFAAALKNGDVIQPYIPSGKYNIDFWTPETKMIPLLIANKNANPEDITKEMQVARDKAVNK
ncbi:ABC transporter substrate-binding protein [Cohnella sp. WQ 127256]|uniref:ABC transporter substrate-binding protein n=1 Tax=Cohnella sp. WQ 127256 TaxID=2938790 RepID=UPI0021197F3E|nr:extracellular solute-binding protein [Cohnella sp. WQ 127256]